MAVRVHVLVTDEAKIALFLCEALADFAPTSPVDINLIFRDTHQ